MLSDDGELSNDISAIIKDYGNHLYIDAASIRELSSLWHKYQWIRKKWKSVDEMLTNLTDQFSVQISYPQREHYQTFLNLRWNIAEDHRDTTDLLIIAHAITEKMPLISSDRKFHFYREQGLEFIYNKR